MDDRFTAVVDKIVDHAEKNSDPRLLVYMRDRAVSALKDSTAKVKHAGDLTEDVKPDLMKSIRDRFPQVTDIVFEVDESLIGGVEIVYKDYRYDGSLRGKFEQLKAKLDN